MKIAKFEFGMIDAIGAAVLALSLGIGTTLLVRGPLRESQGLSAARRQCAQIERELADIQSDRQQLAQDIEKTGRQLADQGGGLPNVRQIERYMAHVTALASANGITVDSLAPSPHIDLSDHVDVYVSFTGRGEYLGFHRMLRGIEQQLDFADVTHFGIVGDDSSKGGCRLEWSIRVRVGRSAGPTVTKVSHVLAP